MIGKTRKRVLVVFGTRPEAIKLAPVIERLRERPERFEVIVAVTAQHREMLDQVLSLFEIEPDHDFDIMRPGQSLADVTVRALEALDPLMRDLAPDAVLVQGDTTTTFVGALAAFYNHIPVGHVEAGLRSDDRYRPFPEEIDRRLVSQLATWHFAPTETARGRLLDEGFAPDDVIMTGNTVIDALLKAAEKPFSFAPGVVADAVAGGKRIVLVTAHRRENWGGPLEDVFQAVRELARLRSDVEVLFAVHRNPHVRGAAQRILGGEERVHLLDPLDYLPFIKLMQASTLILSDSGGIQEEAPSLGKPVLVLRDVTERPEAVEAGTAVLVGTDGSRILAEACRLLSDDAAYAAMARVLNPFGDGAAAARVTAELDRRLS